MSNMSYCRWQNTLLDLQDCYNSVDEDEDRVLSEAEARAKKQLIKLCKRIAEDLGDEG